MKERVSLFWSIGILVALIVSCSGPAAPMAAPTPASMATPNCDNGFSRLSIGATITVVQVGHPNRVRSTPQVANDNVIGEISNGQLATIVDGPVCKSGLVFWKLKSNSIPGGIGWSAEGDGTTHWLAPYKP
jgi:hypothetical protein